MDKGQFLNYLNNEFGNRGDSEKLAEHWSIMKIEAEQIIEECFQNGIRYGSPMNANKEAIHDHILKNHKAFNELKEDYKKYVPSGLFLEVFGLEGVFNLYSLILNNSFEETKKMIEKDSKITLRTHCEFFYYLDNKKVIDSYYKKFRKAAQLFEEYQKVSGFDPDIEEILISIDEAIQKSRNDLINCYNINPKMRLLKYL